jgi:hypothetical protein
MNTPEFQKELRDSVGNAKKSRDILNKRIHFLPISLEVFKATNLVSRIVTSVGEVSETVRKGMLIEDETGNFINLDLFVTSLESFYQKCKEFIDKKIPKKIQFVSGGRIKIMGSGALHPLSDLLADKITKKGSLLLPAQVYIGTELVGVMYSNYDNLQAGFFNEFLNKELKNYVKDSLYDGFKYSPGFDPGHLVGSGPSTVSPLLLRANSLIASITNKLTEEKNVSRQGILNQALADINNEVESLKKRSTYGAKIETILTKEFTDNLHQINAVIVVIQDTLENRYNYGTLIESISGSNLNTILSRITFSNSLIKDVEERIRNTIAGKVSTNTKKEKPIKTFLKTKKESTSLILDRPKIKKVPVPVPKPVVSRTEDLINLQSILNQKLFEQIKQNMGTGSSTNVLNYRTGRLASSVQVTRVSQSRQGMITLFYSYMKNPYATFSGGGLQQFPRSRDPKTLISRSIRQIASDLVTNQLRAVNV